MKNSLSSRMNEKKIKNISILYDYVAFMQIKNIYTVVVLEKRGRKSVILLLYLN